MGGYLENIKSSRDLKRFTVAQLRELASEIRQRIIETLTKNGGHLASNLGIVELTLGIHYVFDIPPDKLIWDVSHQCYTHKLLTGRAHLFHTIRTTGGLSGYASRLESPADCYGGGHAGVGPSAALGIAAARDRLGSNEHVICVIGDGSLTNGIVYEALNNIAQTTRRLILILNDNQWSIAKNVGAIARYLSKIITNPHYNRLHRDFHSLLKKLPKGELALMLAQQVEESFKRALTGATLRPTTQELETDGRGGTGNSVIFEEFGLRYLGPADGHDIEVLINLLEFAKNYDQPIVLHFVTQKGRGYAEAQQAPEKFHGLSPTQIIQASHPQPPPQWADVFGQALVKFCKTNPRIVGITAAMPSGTGLKYLEKELPNQYFDVGIAEEHAVAFAAGLATMGYHPVCAIYSTFLQRAYDCIQQEVCLQDLPVTFCMDRAGLSASDGPTHHGLFDISYLRPIPNVIAMAPSNEDELVDMLYTALLTNHPTFIRYPRGPAEGVPIKSCPQQIPIGTAQVVKDFQLHTHPQIAIFGLGNMLKVAIAVSNLLSRSSIDTAVINPRFIKPLDKETHLKFGSQADLLVTIEDHVLAGGYGSAVLELLHDNGITTQVLRFGWPDKFIEHATTDEDLRAAYGLTPENIATKILEKLSQQIPEFVQNQQAKLKPLPTPTNTPG